MPAEDFVLSVYDEPADGLASRAIARFKSLLPGWVPLAGRFEVELIESVAEIISAAVYSANRAPLATARGIVGLLGVTLDAGTVPTCTVTITANGAVTIPAGFRFRVRSQTPNPVEVDFETLSGVVIVGPLFVGTVSAAGTYATAAVNGTPAGTDAIPVTGSFAVDRIELGSPVMGGIDPESDETWFDRAVTRLERLTDSLVNARQMTAFVSGWPGIAQPLVVDRFDPASVIPGPHLGHITIGAVTTGGGLLSLAGRNALLTAVRDLTPVDLSVDWLDPTITPIIVTVTVRPLAGYTPADVVASVTARLSEWLDATTIPFGSDINANEGIAQTDRASGVDTVLSFTISRPGFTPVATVTLGPYETVTVGAISVTVAV